MACTKIDTSQPVAPQNAGKGRKSASKLRKAGARSLQYKTFALGVLAAKVPNYRKGGLEQVRTAGFGFGFKAFVAGVD
ncbi:MAG: hypothetical protein JKY60_20420 [Kordiimonadaceae bacterium]|nr:hypothetical protein [Kordiimonadaceae bacterium]